MDLRSISINLTHCNDMAPTLGFHFRRRVERVSYSCRFEFHSLWRINVRQIELLIWYISDSVLLELFRFSPLNILLVHIISTLNPLVFAMCVRN